MTADGSVKPAGVDSYERHLVTDTVVDPSSAAPRDRFEAFARAVRDILSQRWIDTEAAYASANPKRIYYLSMEFLIGRTLANNVTNLFLDDAVRQVVAQQGLDWPALLEEEPDAGLGQRRPGPPGRMLPGLNGDDATPRHGLWPPLRIRNVPPGVSRRLAARAAG